MRWSDLKPGDTYEHVNSGYVYLVLQKTIRGHMYMVLYANKSDNVGHSYECVWSPSETISNFGYTLIGEAP